MLISNSTLPTGDLNFIINSIGMDWEKCRGRRLLITGGTGFFGKWLLGSLIQANDRFDLGLKIFCLSRNADLFKQSFPELGGADCVEMVSGDVQSFSMKEDKLYAIIHAATDVENITTERDTVNSVIKGTENVLKIASQTNCERFLYVSSGAIYGDLPLNMKSVNENYRGAPSSMNASSAYGLSKKVGEWLVNDFGRNSACDVITARCFAFVGPYLPMDKHFAMGNFLSDAIEGRDIRVNGNGCDLRTYLYNADLCIWLLKMLFNGKKHAVYNVGGTEVVSIKQLAEKVRDIINPGLNVVVDKQPISGVLPPHYVPDVSKAFSELGLTQSCSIDEAIRKTEKWLQTEGNYHSSYEGCLQ